MGCLIAVILTLAVSCGPSPFMEAGLGLPAMISIDTIEPGVVIGDGVELPIDVVVRSGADEAPDTMAVAILDPDGEVVAQTESAFSGGEGLVLPPDTLSVLASGAYMLRVEVLRAGERVAFTEVPFYYGPGLPEVTAFAVYPSTFMPNGFGVVRASFSDDAVSVGDETSADDGLSTNRTSRAASAGPAAVPVRDTRLDPYLVWSLDGTVVAHGYRSDGLDQVIVRAPGTQGAYRLNLRVLPTAPPEARGFAAGAASMGRGTDVLVQEGSAAPDELGPEESYYTLYHFRGTTEESGVIADLGAQTRVVGAPKPAVGLGVFGYEIDGTSGFSFDRFLFPVVVDRPAPVTLFLRLVSFDDQAGRIILQSSGMSGRYRFELYVDAAGIARLTLSWGSLQIRSEAPIRLFLPDIVSNIAVTIDVTREVPTVLWFLDGVLLSSAPAVVNGSYESVTLAEGAEWRAIEGTTTLGGAGGLTGIVDEFGLYFRDPEDGTLGADGDVYARTMANRYGTDLVYAAGFESGTIGAGTEASGLIAFRDGALILSPGATVTFPPFIFDQDDVDVSLSYRHNTAVPVADEEPVTSEDASSEDSIDTGVSSTDEPVVDEDASSDSEERSPVPQPGRATFSPVEGLSGERVVGIPVLVVATDGEIERPAGAAARVAVETNPHSQTMRLSFVRRDRQLRLLSDDDIYLPVYDVPEDFAGFELTVDQPMEMRASLDLLSVLVHRNVDRFARSIGEAYLVPTLPGLAGGEPAVPNTAVLRSTASRATIELDTAQTESVSAGEPQSASVPEATADAEDGRSTSIGAEPADTSSDEAPSADEVSDEAASPDDAFGAAASGDLSAVESESDFQTEPASSRQETWSTQQTEAPDEAFGSEQEEPNDSSADGDAGPSFDPPPASEKTGDDPFIPDEDTDSDATSDAGSDSSAQPRTR